MFCVVAVPATAALARAHATADECAIHGESAEPYAVDAIPTGCLPAGVGAARVGQGVMPAVFVFGLLRLACAMSGVFGALWSAMGQHPAAVAAGVPAVAAYFTRHMAPRGIGSLLIAFDGGWRGSRAAGV